MFYNMQTVDNVCDNKGQVIFESLPTGQFVNWYYDLLEDGFDFTGWTVEDIDIKEYVDEEIEFFE